MAAVTAVLGAVRLAMPNGVARGRLRPQRLVAQLLPRFLQPALIARRIHQIFRAATRRGGVDGGACERTGTHHQGSNQCRDAWHDLGLACGGSHSLTENKPIKPNMISSLRAEDGASRR
ncbi:hypothetical protein, partial [Rhodopseudomonas palustris]|uniref:hypothetical protein n=1 Tax=Rhodopseudomonas palustris TaxID=1076 RepID=UPI001AEBE103